MKPLATVAVLALLSGPALAQSSQSTDTQHKQGNQAQGSQAAQPNWGSGQNLVAAQKIKKDLENQGFTDVKAVAESFVVQGKSPDRDPVVMTIGRHGMSVAPGRRNDVGLTASRPLEW